MRVSNLRFFLIVTLFLLFQVPELAYGQYFGRNKVQYEDFNFQILHTDHFEIFHYPQTANAIEDIGKLSERWYQRYSKMLNHTFNIKNPIIFYANQADFQQTDIISRIGVATGGVTEGLRNRVIMPFTMANSNTNHVLGHELVHAFQYDIARGGIGGIGATSQLPLWFIEGMAEYLSVGPEDTQTAMWLRSALLNDDIPSIDDLSNSSEYFPYRYGHAVWTFIAGSWGDHVVSDLYVASTTGGGLEGAFSEVLGISVDSVSTMWQNAVREKYSDDLKTKVKPENTGELILGESKGTGTMNVAPSLSPDGRYVAFISEKNIFSLELFLADAETGDIIRRLTSTVGSPHLNALQFVESSGSWSPDGKRFAAVAFIKGDNEIIIVDVEDGGIIQSLSFDDIGAITNPAWSPDGSSLAFTGSDGGYSDIYIYNLETDSLRNVTADPYSDLQPEWSPDGSKIAFVTDRGTGTNLDELEFGNMVVGIMDVSSGDIELIPEFYGAKHINPQFTPDGNSLYYISDYQGYSNIYRYDLQNGRRYQVTNVATGVSGIGNYSPAITVADSSGELMATVFQNSNYSVYKIPEGEKDGRQLINFASTLHSTRLPVINGGGNELVASYLQNPDSDLPSDTAFTLTDYIPDLKLESISGGGGLGVSNRFGTGAVGGVNLYFSDMLRQHQVITNLQVQGSFKDIGGQITYLNTDRRFIWGLSMGHLSFLSRATGTAVDTVQIEEGSAQVLRVDQLNRRAYLNQVSANGRYPFSQTQRMEFNVGYQRISYDIELIQSYISPGGGFVIDQTTEDIEGPSPLNLANGSIAYVEDNSISAFTGPIRGHRLRFELESTTGSLNFLTALADYRRYFYMRPLTLAFRTLHYGRYLEDAESDRLSPNFLGYESFVRGYNIASFSPQECSDTPGGTCPEFSRLIGSRIAVGNAEVRLPILGIEELALFRTRILPTTLTAFFDAGMAWTQDEAPVLEWDRESTERIPVFSSGVSLRFNVLGYLIAEVYYAVPFQRPDKGGYIGFHLAPGW